MLFGLPFVALIIALWWMAWGEGATAPERRRYLALMIANAMAIAAREAELGDGADRAELTSLRVLFQEPGPDTSEDVADRLVPPDSAETQGLPGHPERMGGFRIIRVLGSGGPAVSNAF